MEICFSLLWIINEYIRKRLHFLWLLLIIEQENFPRTVTELLIISQETPDFVTLLIYKKQVLEVFVTERFNTVAFFQSLTAAEMPSKLHIILIFLIFSITRAVIGSRIAGKCYALNQNQLRKSCSVSGVFARVKWLGFNLLVKRFYLTRYFNRLTFNLIVKENSENHLTLNGKS